MATDRDTIATIQAMANLHIHQVDLDTSVKDQWLEALGLHHLHLFINHTCTKMAPNLAVYRACRHQATLPSHSFHPP